MTSVVFIMRIIAILIGSFAHVAGDECEREERENAVTFHCSHLGFDAEVSPHSLKIESPYSSISMKIDGATSLILKMINDGNFIGEALKRIWGGADSLFTLGGETGGKQANLKLSCSTANDEMRTVFQAPLSSFKHVDPSKRLDDEKLKEVCATAERFRDAIAPSRPGLYLLNPYEHCLIVFESELTRVNLSRDAVCATIHGLAQLQYFITPTSIHDDDDGFMSVHCPKATYTYRASDLSIGSLWGGELEQISEESIPQRICAWLNQEYPQPQSLESYIDIKGVEKGEITISFGPFSLDQTGRRTAMGSQDAASRSESNRSSRNTSPQKDRVKALSTVANKYVGNVGGEQYKETREGETGKN